MSVTNKVRHTTARAGTHIARPISGPGCGVPGERQLGGEAVDSATQLLTAA
ncbi:hypothetical protein [Desulfotruncus alcoholivorax]|uniref:hypothetical protein n=1 Tax=Desulfotruncus alcoholivorax TaxID=265477 RepID=UPI000420B2EE|nr:hypothetical protein [Desulfotruncus alcoholivorax]